MWDIIVIIAMIKLTRKQLRYLIKEMAAKQPNELSDKFHWEVTKWSAKASDEEEWDGWDGEQIVNNVLIAGYVQSEDRRSPSRVAGIFIKQKPESDCVHWEVKSASVSRYSDVFGDDLIDLGPMMYDIAMEIAGENGMISDSDGTSDEAKRVWDFYLQNRLGVDVDVTDIPLGSCDRPVDTTSMEFPRDDFRLKIYRKKSGTPSIIDKLKNMGKIRF